MGKGTLTYRSIIFRRAMNNDCNCCTINYDHYWNTNLCLWLPGSCYQIRTYTEYTYGNVNMYRSIFWNMEFTATKKGILYLKMVYILNSPPKPVTENFVV